jgi:hypothetical protein
MIFAATAPALSFEIAPYGSLATDETASTTEPHVRFRALGS